MKIEIKGFMHKVLPVTTSTTKNGTYKKQDIIIRKPPFTDEFGETKGKDQFFKFSISENRITIINAGSTMEGKKCIVAGYLNGFEYNGNGATEYGLSLSLNSLNLI